MFDWKPTGTTKFDHVEEKEKFFDGAFYPFRIVLSLFVSSSIEVLGRLFL